MTSREKVEYIVRHYSDFIERMRLLDLEIERYLPLTKEDAIDMLTFPGRSDDRVLVRHDVDTDRLMRIALGYKGLCWKINQGQF